MDPLPPELASHVFFYCTWKSLVALARTSKECRTIAANEATGRTKKDVWLTPDLLDLPFMPPNLVFDISQSADKLMNFGSSEPRTFLDEWTEYFNVNAWTWGEEIGAVCVAVSDLGFRLSHSIQMELLLTRKVAQYMKIETLAKFADKKLIALGMIDLFTIFWDAPSKLLKLLESEFRPQGWTRYKRQKRLFDVLVKIERFCHKCPPSMWDRPLNGLAFKEATRRLLYKHKVTKLSDAAWLRMFDYGLERPELAVLLKRDFDNHYVMAKAFWRDVVGKCVRLKVKKDVELYLRNKGWCDCKNLQTAAKRGIVDPLLAVERCREKCRDSLLSELVSKMTAKELDKALSLFDVRPPKTAERILICDHMTFLLPVYVARFGVFPALPMKRLALNDIPRFDSAMTFLNEGVAMKICRKEVGLMERMEKSRQALERAEKTVRKRKREHDVAISAINTHSNKLSQR